MLKILLYFFVAVMFFGCSQEQSTQQTVSTPQTATEATPAKNNPEIADRLLVFFLDPNGGPCKMQVNILKQMENELNGKVLIRPVQTTVPEDHNLFYAYGIRGLPTILLADSSGKEIKRLPPGVQTAEQIRSLINQSPVN